MKIAIIGPLSFPSINELKGIIPLKNNETTNFHPHPWIFNLALGLKHIAQIEVHLISISSLTTKNCNFKYQDIHFHVLKPYSNIINYPSFFIFEILKILKILKKINPKIVHGQSRSFEALAAILYSKTNILTNHGDLYKHRKSLFPTNRVLNLLNRRYLKLSYFAIYQSIVKQLTSNEIIVSNSCRASGIKKSIRIFNPINKVFFSHKWNNTSKKQILFIGSITPLKRPHLLIEYLTKNQDASLLIISQFIFKDAYSQSIKEKINEYNLESRVEFMSFSTPETLALHISESSVFCLPSTYESFGMVIAEAMAVGCPVIGTNVGGIPELIQNGITGLLFKSDAPDELFKGIDQILTDSSLAERLSKNARSWAYENFHPHEIAKKTLKVYTNISKEENE